MEFLQARRRRLDYQATFGSAAGRRVLADILQRSGDRASAFTAGQPDVTNFKLGRQDIGQSIVKKLNMSDEEIQKLNQDGTPYGSK